LTLALGGAAIGGLVVTSLVLWSVHIQHTQSYLTLVLLYGAAAGALLLLPPRAMYAIGGLQIAYVVLVWLVDPLHTRTPDFACAALAALSLAALVALAIPSVNRRSREPRLAIGTAT
jgi:hypothetical protein